MMHILIIPGEELNEENQLSSVFEIHQAVALKSLDVKVGFISVNLEGSIYNDIKIGEWKSIFRNRFQSLKQNIKGINLVASFGRYRTPAFLQLYRKERIQAGVLAYKHYCKEFGHPDLIHAHSRFLDSILIAKKIKNLFGVPYIFTEHSSFHQRNIVTKQEYLEYISAVEQAKSWLVVSKSLGQAILSNIVRLKVEYTKSYQIVPNVVDPDFIFVENNRSDKFVFLNVASLDSNKNHFLLLDSFAKVAEKFSNVELRIVGVGSLEQQLKHHVKMNGIKNVNFLGTKNRTEVKDEYVKSNAFVLSSNVETFGVAVTEALAIGRPVVSTKCGGPEFIIDENNGILAEPNSINDLADAMIEMIEGYERFNLVEISRNCIAKYGSRSIAKDLKKIYKEILI
jgi:glycosyltransferase involved in cell wall biosynthesis